MHRLPISCVNCEKTLCYQCYRYLQKAQTRNIESYQGVRCPGCKYEKGFPRKQPSFNRALCMVLWDLQLLSHPHTSGEPTAVSSSKRGLRDPFLRLQPTTAPFTGTLRAHLSMTGSLAHREGVGRSSQSIGVESLALADAATFGSHAVSPAEASTESQQSRTIVTTNYLHRVPVPPFVDVPAEGSDAPDSVNDQKELSDAVVAPKHPMAASLADPLAVRRSSLPPPPHVRMAASEEPPTGMDSSAAMGTSTEPSILPATLASKRRKKEELSDLNAAAGTHPVSSAVVDNGVASVQRAFPSTLKGKGWEGFAQLDPNDLPTSLVETLQLLDHLFPDGSYYQRLYVEADVLSSKGQHRWGKTTRDKLRKLRLRFPNLPGVAWYQDKRDKDWVSPNKECLERFVKVLMELDDLLK